MTGGGGTYADRGYGIAIDKAGDAQGNGYLAGQYGTTGKFGTQFLFSNGSADWVAWKLPKL